ncbi:MAG TPA: ornithine cyclodeaminase family protein [Candidatus Competibacteraceae bacterium]|nr:ornithine cyclodeaminase family protein [Candidatus Competibacteraceae bacterium]
MLQLDADAVARHLPWPALVEALREGFRAGCEAPLRHHHTVRVPGEPDATLLLMPAWQPGAFLGVKLVSVFPGNGARGLPAIHGSYLLSSARTGELLALLDGAALTARRTAAASALAAGYLARADARHLLIVGTGALAPNLAAAHAGVRPITRISVWGRDPAKAETLAARLRGDGLPAAAVADLAATAAQADIVSCATLSQQPLIQGAWLKPGAHLDLVGGFTPAMREADDEAVRRASVFVDTRQGAGHEAGDIVQPLASGVLTPASILADLHELCRGQHPGRRRDDEITLFKSVGASLEDLVAAVLAYRSAHEARA